MRFITEDTNKGDVKDPLSLNLYTYCQGNPVRYFDRDGHKKEEVNAEQEGDSISSNDTGGGTSLYSDPNYGGNPSGKLSLKTRFENWWKGIGRWKVGDDIYNPTAKGNSPSWSAVRQRFWKNEAAKPDAAKIYGAENIERMKRGLAPQRYNPDKGGMESMELSHEPVPFREGGTEFVPRWPQDHASVDPYRHPGY